MVNPTKVDSILEEIEKNEIPYKYARGYDSSSDKQNKSLINEAVKIARDAYRVILFIGLTSHMENANIDRTHLEIPKSHQLLLEEISKVNKSIIVVLYGGSPVIMPWISKAKSLLHAHLGGQAVGSAIVDILFGDINPSGKTTESYITDIKYCPSYNYFAKDNLNIEYRESIFVGYRYYQSLADKDKRKRMLFPFGYGLSYTTFEYKNMKLSEKRGSDYSLLARRNITVTFELENIGNYDGSEVVQLYISQKNPSVFRPKRELRGFQKVFLKKGEKTVVTFKIGYRSFAYYNTETKNWAIDADTYTVELGTNSEHILLSENIIIQKQKSVISKSRVNILDNDEKIEKLYPYFNINKICNSAKNDSLVIEDNYFYALFEDYNAVVIEPAENKYSRNSTLEEIKHTFWGARFYKKVMSKIKVLAESEIEYMLREYPLRIYAYLFGSSGVKAIERLVDLLNKNYKNAIKKFFTF